MFTPTIKEYTTTSRIFFHDHLDTEFRAFQKNVAAMLTKEFSLSHGMAFMNLTHDMWTNANNDNLLGTSIRLIDSDFKIVTLAVLLSKNNVSHAADFNGTFIILRFLENYHLDIERYTKFVTSDTTPSAKNVADYIGDAEQVDCEMHVLNLCMLYGLGLRENTQTKNEIVDGKKMKVQRVVTPGGEFKGGLKLVEQFRKLPKYFASTQKKEILKKIQDSQGLPVGIPSLDGKTRVASCHKLFRTTIYHKKSLEAFYSRMDSYGQDDDFLEIWDGISDNDWDTVRQIEVILEMIATYTKSEAQSSSVVTCSYTIYFRYLCRKFMEMDSMDVIDDQQFKKGQAINDGKKSPTYVADFTSDAKLCLERTKLQMKKRFKEEDCLNNCLPVFMDPRTAAYAGKIIQNVGLYEDAKKEIMGRHREVFRKISENESKISVQRAAQRPRTRPVTSIVRSNAFDDMETMLNPIDETPEDEMTEDSLDLKADAIFEEWLLRCGKIKWSRFRIDGTDTSAPLNSLLDLYVFADPLLWLKREGKQLFPSIALLARITLARCDNGAFQESVFSSAAGTMNIHQTKMDTGQFEKRALLFHNKKFVAKNIHYI